jgi:hypothetical protein
MPQSLAPSSAPPPRSGGGIYIAAVVVLLLGIGVLIFWKLKGNNENQVAPLPLPTQTNPSTLVEPPPPPPPVVEEEVARVDAGVRVASNGNGAGPCAANRCSGSANNAITSALSARAGSARPCYERALRVNSALQGKLTVNVRIDPQGNVCNASVIEDAIHSVEVSNCVMGMFRSAKFPPPNGGCLDARVPLSFVPREGK